MIEFIRKLLDRSNSTAVAEKISNYKKLFTEIDIPKDLWRKLRISDQEQYASLKEKVSLEAIDFKVFFNEILLPAIENKDSLKELFPSVVLNCAVGITRSVVANILLQNTDVDVKNQQLRGSLGMSSSGMADLIDSIELNEMQQDEDGFVIINGVSITTFMVFLTLSSNSELVREISDAHNITDENTRQAHLDYLHNKISDPTVFDVWLRLCKRLNQQTNSNVIIVNTDEYNMKQSFRSNNEKIKKSLSEVSYDYIQSALRSFV